MNAIVQSKIALTKRPKLVAVAGPLAGHSFAVPDAEACVGRAPYNWLSVRSPTVSRQHFQVEGSSGRWKIVDLESRNGTFVNDDAVRGERWLEDGDRIRAGEAQFVFVVEDDEIAPPPSAEDSGLQTKTILVFDGESTFLRPWLTESISERRLNALLRISALVQTVTAISELREGVTKHVAELMPPCEVMWEEQAELTERGILTEDEDWRGRVFTIRVPLKIGSRNRGSLVIHSKETLGRDHLDLATAVATVIASGVQRRLSPSTAQL